MAQAFLPVHIGTNARPRIRHKRVGQNPALEAARSRVREINAWVVREWRVFFARKEAVLQQLRALEIHGLRFYDIVFTCTEPPGAEPEAARVGGEMIYAGAQPGDRILVEKIANVVSRVQKL